MQSSLSDLDSLSEAGPATPATLMLRFQNFPNSEDRMIEVNISKTSMHHVCYHEREMGDCRPSVYVYLDNLRNSVTCQEIFRLKYTKRIYVK